MRSSIQGNADGRVPGSRVIVRLTDRDGQGSVRANLLRPATALCLVPRCGCFEKRRPADGYGPYLGFEAAILLHRRKSGYLSTRYPACVGTGAYSIIYGFARLSRTMVGRRIRHLF